MKRQIASLLLRPSMSAMLALVLLWSASCQEPQAAQTKGPRVLRAPEATKMALEAAEPHIGPLKSFSMTVTRYEEDNEWYFAITPRPAKRLGHGCDVVIDAAGNVSVGGGL